MPAGSTLAGFFYFIKFITDTFQKILYNAASVKLLYYFNFLDWHEETTSLFF